MREAPGPDFGFGFFAGFRFGGHVLAERRIAKERVNLDFTVSRWVVERWKMCFARYLMTSVCIRSAVSVKPAPHCRISAVLRPGRIRHAMLLNVKAVRFMAIYLELTCAMQPRFTSGVSSSACPAPCSGLRDFLFSMTTHRKTRTAPRLHHRLEYLE